MGGGPGGKRTIGPVEGGGIAVWGAETAEGKFQIGNPGGPVGGKTGGPAMNGVPMKGRALPPKRRGFM